MMSPETEQCPCFAFDLDVGARQPDTCFCGDAHADHDREGNCLVQHRLDAPYDPDLAEGIMRLMRRWREEHG
jgi:hypothetical protein